MIKKKEKELINDFCEFKIAIRFKNEFRKAYPLSFSRSFYSISNKKESQFFGLVLEYTVFIYNCINIILTKLTTECTYEVVQYFLVI